MRKRYNTERLRDVETYAREYVNDCRDIREKHQAELADLEKRAKDYNPAYLLQQKTEVTQKALRSLRFIGESLKDVVKGPLNERELHSRAFYLQDMGVTTELCWADREKAALVESLQATQHAMRQFAMIQRLARMSDNKLVEMAAFAVKAGDFALAGLVAEEANVRSKGSMSELSIAIDKHINTLSIPDADAAEEVFSFLDEALAEVVQIERLITNPDDRDAHAWIRSREISREQAAREHVDRDNKKTAEEEARKKKAEEQKSEAETLLGRTIKTPEAA
jgi:hypothetical protein